MPPGDGAVSLQTLTESCPAWPQPAAFPSNHVISGWLSPVAQMKVKQDRNAAGFWTTCVWSRQTPEGLTLESNT